MTALCQQIRMPSPSPRVRGSPARVPEGGPPSGSIPARAGEHGGKSGHVALGPVHPRACGGAPGRALRFPRHPGPSPRERGSHVDSLGRDPRAGSIPARAAPPGARGPLHGARIPPMDSGGDPQTIVNRVGALPHLKCYRIRWLPHHECYRPDSSRGWGWRGGSVWRRSRSW